MKTINLLGCYIAASTAGFCLAAVLTQILHLPLMLALLGAFLAALRLYKPEMVWYDYFIYGFAALAMLGFIYVQF